MIVQSAAFEHGERIPRRFTCDGNDISPPLSWGEAPPDTASFALVVDDPDAPAGTWVHWIVFNLPATETELAEGPRIPTRAVEGRNSWSRRGYGGPCPPSGTHRYFFRLYALDTALPLGPGATADELAEAIRGHVLAEAVLMGRYARG